MLGDQPGIEAEKTVIVPVSSDKGLCGGINTTVVKYSKVVSVLSARAPCPSWARRRARSSRRVRRTTCRT